MTVHSLVEQDCRNLNFIPDASVHLVITHPPAFGTETESVAAGQLSAIGDYAAYLVELDAVWAECSRVLVPGGYFTCVASPVARHPADLPLGADVLVRARRFGFDPRQAIRWLEARSFEIDESPYLGKPNQPCGDSLIKSHELLVMRKPGMREVTDAVALESRMNAEYFAMCSHPVWLIPADPEPLHPQSFPVEMAERLIRMYSFCGDKVLDPFAGSGTTNAAAIGCRRNSIAVEVEPLYLRSMTDRFERRRWPEDEITITRLVAGAEEAAAV